MMFIVWLTDENPAEFYITRNDAGPDGYEWPLYIEPDDISTFIRLFPWPRNAAEPAFAFNPGSGTPVEEATWGYVKVLFK